MRILVFNGSLGGESGNTARALQELTRELTALGAEVAMSDLGQMPSREEIAAADGYVFATGVYWDSWGSPLQKFFEHATPLEGDSCWFGKPAACLVTMHSVGGKEVLSRLQGVLNTFGLYVPPMSALAYSLAGHIALRDGAGSHADDLWSLGDLKVVAGNLVAALANPRPSWLNWPVDRANPQRIWLTDVST